MDGRLEARPKLMSHWFYLLGAVPFTGAKLSPAAHFIECRTAISYLFFYITLGGVPNH